MPASILEHCLLVLLRPHLAVSRRRGRFRGRRRRGGRRRGPSCRQGGGGGGEVDGGVEGAAATRSVHPSAEAGGDGEVANTPSCRPRAPSRGTPATTIVCGPIQSAAGGEGQIPHATAARRIRPRTVSEGI